MKFLLSYKHYAFLISLALLLLGNLTSTAAQIPSGTVSRPDTPLSRDPRRPNTYELENELRNAKIGHEVELALKEGNDAFSAQPPRFKDAEQAYIRAADLEPKEARAYMGLGRVYAAQNDVEKTITAFKKAVDIKPKYAEAHFNLALVYLAIGNKTEASKEYETLKPLDKDLARKLKDALNK